MSAVLPFDGFLEVLRRKGYGVGLHEYMALASLLARWDRTHAEEFGDAVTALVARNEDEVQAIRRLFAEIYLAPPRVPTSRAAQPTVFVRSWTWSVAAISAIVLVS